MASIAATELLLCRVTGGPVRLGDLAAAVALAALLAVVAEALRRGGRAGHAVGIGLVTSLYGLALLLPIVIGRTSWILAPALVVLGGLIFIVGPLLRTGRLSLRVVTALYAVHALAAWAVLAAQIGPPERSEWLPVLGAFALVLALGRRAPLVAVLALTPALASAPAPATGDGRGPDILLISVDTLRADAAREMASVRWLARAGVSLEGQAPSPWTLPSMATLLTGVAPDRHHAVRDADAYGKIAADVETLAERLRAAGWDTALTAENPFTGAQFGLHRGFRQVDHESDRSWVLPQAPYNASARPLGGTLAAWMGLARATPHGVTARLESARRFIAAAGDRPLFLWIHILDPHLPYTHAWSLDRLPLWERAALAHTNRNAIGEAPSEQTLATLKQAYLHEVAVVDEALLAFLRDLPPAPRGRIVVFTADHGEAFGEHGGWEHGHSMYQELLGVPLVIRGIDGIAPGGLAGLIDVAPTLLRAVGLSAEGLGGRALQEPTAGAVAIGSVNPLYGSLDLRALRSGDSKWIGEAGSTRFYDLATDPAERDPRPVPQEAVAERLPPIPSVETGARLDDGTRDALRALGYVDGDGS